MDDRSGGAMTYLRRGLGAFVVCWIVFGGRAHAADLPPDLKYLETLAGDENGLVDAARRFQLQQFKLIDWDQKLVEESPSPVIDAATRQDLGSTICAALAHIGYRNAGTMEFFREIGRAHV